MSVQSLVTAGYVLTKPWGVFANLITTIRTRTTCPNKFSNLWRQFGVSMEDLWWEIFIFDTFITFIYFMPAQRLRMGVISVTVSFEARAKEFWICWNRSIWELYFLHLPRSFPCTDFRQIDNEIGFRLTHVRPNHVCQVLLLSVQRYRFAINTVMRFRTAVIWLYLNTTSRRDCWT